MAQAGEKIGGRAEHPFDLRRCFNGDLCPKAAAGHIHKHALAKHAQIDRCRRTFGDQHKCIEQIAGRDAAGAGEVVGGAERQDADRTGPRLASSHNAVYDFVERAVAAGRDDRVDAGLGGFRRKALRIAGPQVTRTSTR